MGAQAGTLTFMVGGDHGDLDRARPILEVMGRNVFHAGPAGNGQAAKVCNNLLAGISMIAVSEVKGVTAQADPHHPLSKPGKGNGGHH